MQQGCSNAQKLDRKVIAVNMAFVVKYYRSKIKKLALLNTKQMEKKKTS